MIGSRVRLALRIAAIAYALIGLVAGVWGLADAIVGDRTIMGLNWQYWTMVVAGVVAPLVQAGILWVLLSIDERIENRGH